MLTVTWNAAVLDQPGVYTTSLYIDSNDPSAQNTAAPITLTVQPSTTMGLITGVVSTTGQCDVNAAPLTGAAILLQNTTGYLATTYTAASGVYRHWLLAAGGPYSLTISAPNQSVTSTVVAVTSGVTSTHDFTLRLQQPCLSLNPATISVTVSPGGVITPNLIVTNSGAVPLSFTIYEVSSTVPYGGPDAFGYTWRPASYNWIEASDGMPLNLPDDGEVTIVLPFAFPYYDRASNFVRVGNNGALLFDAQTGEVPYVNVGMNQAPDDLLAPYWDDLDAYQGNVYWKTVGSPPNRRVVIEWRDRPHVNGDPSAITFEIVLYENGNMVFQYQDVDFGDPGDNAGASATIGIRGAAQSVEYSFARPSLSAQQAICFTRPGNTPCDEIDYPWLTVVPTATINLSGTPPLQQIISVTLDAVSIPIGVRPRGALRLIGNDPARRAIDIPVTFNIQWQWVYLPLVRK
jgi:hypothetical protein